jgi:hypothetical protein
MSSTGHLDVQISAFGRYQQYFCGAQRVQRQQGPGIACVEQPLGCGEQPVLHCSLHLYTASDRLHKHR